ncbi:MAG: TIGR01777 family oxidoreductase [Candidatus Methylomirabilales bacterium]
MAGVSPRVLRVAVTGSHGLVGSAVCASLTAAGHAVLRLVRRAPAAANEARWDPHGGADAARLQGLDAVVHLAGENIAAGRWTEARKAEIRNSRVQGTAALCETLAALTRRPRVLVNASAIGIYGNRGSAVLREDSDPGSGFLAAVCRDWEAATARASTAGIRVVLARFGMVLSPAGGALKSMLRPFRLGIGGRIGDGGQYVSWIALDDVVGALVQAIEDERLAGPLNVVAPAPVTNADFARALGRAVSRPAVLPLPAFAARLAFGEMADELLLASQRVLPARLQAAGYRFLYPELDPALRHLLRF